MEHFHLIFDLGKTTLTKKEQIAIRKEDTGEDYMNYFENPLSERKTLLDIQKRQEIGLLL